MSSKLVKCKTCDAVMAKSARRCPACGAKNKKPIFKKWWFWVLIFVIVVAAGSSGGNDDVSANDNVPSVTTPSTTNDPVKSPEPSEELAKLGAKENPCKITVEELVAEINANKDAAKEKYNGQWVEITGKVLDADNVAGMTRFYLYGKSGDSGLRIICWVNEEVLKPFAYQGDTVTFLGQLREITTVSATEIGDCQIISD